MVEPKVIDDKLIFQTDFLGFKIQFRKPDGSYEEICLCQNLQYFADFARLIVGSLVAVTNASKIELPPCIVADDKARASGLNWEERICPDGQTAGRAFNIDGTRTAELIPNKNIIGPVIENNSMRFGFRKASRDRRRVLGGSSALPDTLRHYYTEGQRSVLCIVAGEIKRHGICDLPNDKIAALAGVCRTTVQTTMHEARRLGHITITERPQPGRKSLTNVVEIISPEWRAWIRRGSSAAGLIGSNPLKMVSPTKNIELRKKEATDGKEHRIYCGPPRHASEWDMSRYQRPPQFSVPVSAVSQR